jgi:hypothetical protein
MAARSFGATQRAARSDACTTTSGSFVEERTGVAVIRGRITQAENLSAGNIRRFNDGIAVTMSFSETQKKVMELGPGAILVYGGDTDYVLNHAPGTPAR